MLSLSYPILSLCSLLSVCMYVYLYLLQIDCFYSNLYPKACKSRPSNCFGTPSGSTIPSTMKVLGIGCTLINNVDPGLYPAYIVARELAGYIFGSCLAIWFYVAIRLSLDP